jgi:hypothetical protein
VRNLEEQLTCSRDEAEERLSALKDVLARIKPLAEPPQETKDQETETIKVYYIPEFFFRIPNETLKILQKS